MSEFVHGFTVYMAVSVSDGLEPVHGYVPSDQAGPECLGPPHGCVQPVIARRQGEALGVSATVWLCGETEETESWEFTGQHFVMSHLAHSAGFLLANRRGAVLTKGASGDR